jgi:hypothetical protein
MGLEDGSSAAVALEDGGSSVALGGGIGWWSKIVAAVLGGGGSKRTCTNGIGISITEAGGELLHCWPQHWQGRQERTHLMRGIYVDRDGKEIGVSQRWWW